MNNCLFKNFILLLIMFIGIPVAATMFIKPDKTKWQKQEEVQSTLNSLFSVVVYDEKGSFEYAPEDLTVFMTESIMPYDFISVTKDETAKSEYYKALTVVCRTNIVKAWKDEGCPDKLDYKKTDLAQIILTENTYDLNKIREAAKATAGVVITYNISNDKNGEVVAAPFFTSEKGELIAKNAGNGIGLSLNFAFVKAQEGLDFVDILQFFYDGMGISVL